MSASRATSRDYRRPRRALAIRALHALWRALGAAHRPALSVADLEASARAAERLDDFGDPAYREPLTRLVDAIEQEAALHPLGRLIQRGRLTSMLRNRLRLEAMVAAHPEITARTLTAPIVITGLPRTGTTFLQRLLCAYPRTRSMWTWEGLNPAPLDVHGRRRWDSRPLRARVAHRVIATLAPHFLACHPIEPDGVDEEIVLVDHSFLSLLPHVMMHVPSYVRWQEAQGQGAAYCMLRRMLLLLDWQRGGERWVLKTPQHLEFIDELFEVFPDAYVVHCHRDPAVAVASTCSMVGHARGFLSDVVNPVEVGRSWLAKTALMMARMAEQRAARGEGRFIDVRYEDLIASPVAEARRVLTTAGLPWTPEAEAAVAAQSVNRDHERFGRHVYALEDFAITPADIDEHFGSYRRRFDLVA